MMKEKFAAIFATKDRDEWTAIFGDADACVTPVLSPSEAAVHPYNTARNVFSVSGTVRPQQAPRFSKTSGSIPSEPVSTSSQSEELAKWGIGADRQAALREAGVIGRQ
jgi:alpha-methylacyl-CoA racemase